MKMKLDTTTAMMQMGSNKKRKLSSPSPLLIREATLLSVGPTSYVDGKISNADAWCATTFSGFPSLVFFHIFQYLELVDMVRLSYCARAIQQEINSFMKTVDQLVFPRQMENISEDAWKKILYKCPHLTYLDASACALPVDIIVNMVKKYPQIKILRTAYDAWNHELNTASRNYSLHLLENIPHTLQRMSLCVADVHKLQQQLPQCQNLRTLTLWRTHLLPNILTPQLALPPTTKTLKLFNIDFEHNAMKDCLSSATNLRSLKIRDCYYDDAQELAPLAERQLTKLEIMHSPVGRCFADFDSSSLVKFGIDWCPGVAGDVEPDVLVNFLARATTLRSLKLSSGSLDHELVSKLSEANPIPKSLQKLQITTFSSCNVVDADIDDADSFKLLSLFPPSLSQLSLCHFPKTHCIPLCHFPYLRLLELSEMGAHLEDIEQSLKRLSHLDELKLRDMVGVSSFKVSNKNIRHVVLEKCHLQSVDFVECPKLAHIRLQEMTVITKFNIEPSCTHVRKLAVKKCPTLHHFLLSLQFFEMKKQLRSLNTIKIEDCEFCYHDVRLCLELMKTQLLCALVDLDQGSATNNTNNGNGNNIINNSNSNYYNNIKVKKMQHQVSAACDKLVDYGISSSCPKDLSDITVDPQLRLVTNFPFYRWIEIISCNTMPTTTARRKSISDWLFCMFKIHDYYNVGAAY